MATLDAFFKTRTACAISQPQPLCKNQRPPYGEPASAAEGFAFCAFTGWYNNSYILQRLANLTTHEPRLFRNLPEL